jgi:hypothetical protein
MHPLARFGRYLIYAREDVALPLHEDGVIEKLPQS